MTIETQLKLRSNPKYISFIHENPIWYKKLNRNPLLFKYFVSDMKEKYSLTPSDKLNKTIEGINMIEQVLSILK